MQSYGSFRDEIPPEQLGMLAELPGLDGPLPPLTFTQNWLWDCWQNFLGRALAYIGDDPFFLMEMGDAQEGRHHGTLELMHHDILVHLWISHEILMPVVRLPNCVRYYQLQGTDCHARTLESTLGKIAGAERNPKTGDWAWPYITMEVQSEHRDRPFRLHAQHHMPVSMIPWTRAAAFSREITREQANAAGRRHPVPDMIVRAHRHQAGVYRDHTGIAIATAPWQANTRYGKRVTYDWVAIPGGCVVDFNHIRSDGFPDAEAFTYIPAPDKPETL